MKKASKATFAWSADASTTFEIGIERLRELGVLDVLEHDALGALSRTTRSSFGRLNAAVWTPRLPSPAAKTSLTTTIGASAPSFGIAMARIDRQVVLDLLQLGRELLQLRRSPRRREP